MQITVTIDRIEEDIAQLQFPDGAAVTWPVDKLPKGCQEGDVVVVTLERSERIKKQRNKEIQELQED